MTAGFRGLSKRNSRSTQNILAFTVVRDFRFHAEADRVGGHPRTVPVPWGGVGNRKRTQVEQELQRATSLLQERLALTPPSKSRFDNLGKA